MNWSEQLVEQIADKVFQRIQSHLDCNNRIFQDKLLFDESEAADILGIPRHVLKGCRERGEINPAKVGKKWAYSREVISAFAQKGAN